MAYSDGLGYCKCMSGYIFGKNFLGQPYCVSGDTTCSNDYDYASEYDSLAGKCKCMYGYVWGKDLLGRDQCISTAQYCNDQLGFSSRYNSLSDSCECMSGYLLSGGQCISESTYCFNTLGVSSRYNSLTDKCECNSGYELSIKTLGGFKCTSCFLKYGLHSSYDYLSKTCKCDSGYTLNDQNQCVEKQNNVYFLLKEVDTTAKKAVIKSDYDFTNYLITYGIGCSSWSSYLNNRIVVNLGTDYDLDIFDKVVLQNHDQVCDVLRVERVDSSFSLFEEDEGAVLGESIYISTSPQKENVLGHSLVKLSGSPDIYAIFNQTKRKIRSLEIFNSYYWTTQSVKAVTQSYLDSLQETSLIKTSTSPDVYILAKGFKRLLASIEIFNSYGLDWSKVVTISQAEMNSYSRAPLIERGNDFYWLDAYRIRHKFPAVESLTRNGYNTRDAIEVNDIEFGSYGDGAPITS